MNELKIGDIVMHRGGGPDLIVTAIDGDDVAVRWTSTSGEQRSGSFKMHTLMRPIPPRRVS